MPRLLVLAALVAAGSAAAQPARQCGTAAPTVLDRLQTAALTARFRDARGADALRRRAETVTVPVAVHVVSSGLGVADGNVPDAQIDVLNAAFGPRGFRFVLASVDRTVEPAWASGLRDNSAGDRAMRRALALDPARFLNVYTIDAAGDLLGWATLPHGRSESDRLDGVVLDRETLPGGAFAPFNEGDTGTHEVGHWLGLYHTFNESAPAGDACGGAGDEVDDTPVEARPAQGCPTGRDTCPALAGVDPITNFMDYSDDACMVEFTPGQADRMAALASSFRPTIAAGVAPLAAPSALAFGEVFVENAVARTVRVVNPTSTPLVVSAVAASDPAFVVSGASFTVAPGGSVPVEVTFVPDDARAYSATLTVTTDGPSLTTELSGEGRFAPDLGVPTPAAALALAPGASDQATVTISNAGRGVLDYAFVGRAATVREPTLSAGPAQTPTSKEASVPSASRLGAGGPDAFGTTWVDSDEPGGPAYAWVDLGEAGTVHPLDDDGAVEVDLPFAFPFYGALQGRAWISANGFLTFGGAPGDESYRNLDLPTAQAPAIVAPYWDDLDASSGGRVLSGALPDGRFAVTWEDLPHYAESGDPGRFRFQALLSSDGTVVFQYGAIEPGAFAASATVGVQPEDGSTGLGIAYNAAYVREGLAVRIAPRAEWIREVTPPSGTVAPGGEQLVTIGLDAGDLTPGAYQDLLTLRTNDPDRPETRLHVVLGVGGVLAPPALVDPEYGARGTPARLRLDWLDAAGADGYELQVARDEAFQDLVFSDVADGSSAVFSGETGTAYWWRARAVADGEPSVWSVPFPFTTGTDPGEIVDVPMAFAVGALFPNPAASAVRVPFTLLDDGEVRANVFDATGRLVLEVESRVAYRAGVRNTLRLDVSALPPGLYLVRLAAGAESAARRVVVVR